MPVARTLGRSFLCIAILAAWTPLDRTGPSALAASVLPFGGTFGELEVQGNNRVWASGGDHVLGVDAAGAVVVDLNVPGATGLAVVGTELFVASTGGDAVEVFDMTADPPVHDRTIDLAPYVEPRSMVFAGGRLLVGAWDGSRYELVAVMPDGTDLQGTAWPDFPFVVDPIDPDELWSGTSGGVCRWDVSNLPIPAPTCSVLDVYMVNDVAIHPDGSELVVAASNPYDFPQYATGTTTRTLLYNGDPYPNAVATTAGRGGLVAGGTDSPYGPDVWVYERGRRNAVWTFDFDSTSRLVIERGIEWSPDSGTLWVVTTTAGDGFELNAFHPFAKESSLALTVSDRRAEFRETVRVTAHLEGGSANRTVRIYADDELLKAGSVGGDGAISVAIEAVENVRLRAVYDGELRWTPDMDAVTLGVHVRLRDRLRGFRDEAGRYKLYARGDPAIYVVRVIPNHSGRRISFVLEANAGDGWGWAGGTTADLDVYSIASVGIGRLKPGIDYRVKTYLPGHGDHIRTVSAWRYFRIG